ncbi:MULTISPECIES: helix-turn-helix transcriptional regulator [unclassified Dysgonomonas]|jgi:transcriptional regulator with XRE-family HTH domain|uniref:helix-turn-helix transcriptional regulator n=1 Tax=unclassified Dysgonomonas TaxID=2630389 RepID=UPI0025BBF2B5|nr:MULTISPECIES: helix-turn-helix transcriptional regulator [unclassified Dysgonomonas]MDR2004373.1 helix-turn-helix domain-containing protein [Prevotella sp.]HMM04976.1 helix-turn-helix transcriptional regulator [Dysgonomonas sp.]
MKIGEYIQKARKEIGYTQDDIAKHLGLSRPSIGNIEKGRQSLDLDSLTLLVDYLKISIPDLFKTVYGITILTDSAKIAKIKRLEYRKLKIDQEIESLKTD